MADMTVPQMFVLAMAVSSAMLVGSGFNDWANTGYDPGLEGAAEDLRETAHENTDASTIAGALNLLGLAISAINILVTTFVWVYLFPAALMNIGFPAWFAVPIGLPVLYINLIGTAEFLRGYRTG